MLLLERLVNYRVLAVNGSAHGHCVDDAVYQSNDEQYGRFGEVRQLSQHGCGYQRQHHEVREVRWIHAVDRRITLAVSTVR